MIFLYRYKQLLLYGALLGLFQSPPAEAVIVSVTKWQYHNKSIIICSTIEGVQLFKDEEYRQVGSLVGHLQQAGTLLSQPVKLLVEHVDELDKKNPFYSLLCQSPIQGIPIQSIETRCASEAARLLLCYGTTAFLNQETVASAYQRLYIHEVTFSAVISEWNTIHSILDLAYQSFTSEQEQQTYRENMKLWTRLFNHFLSHVQSLYIDCTLPIATLLSESEQIALCYHDRCKLASLILQMSTLLFDMHLLNILLTAPDFSQTAVITGIDHTNTINTILASLGAQRTAFSAQSTITKESYTTGKGIIPLTAQELKIFG